MEKPQPNRPLSHPAARETWEEDYMRTSVLKIDPAYQRPLDQGRVARIARAWSDARCLMLEVNRRPNGEYFVMNGQHRLAAAQLAGVEWLPCRIFSFPRTELEALWFAGQAQESRTVKALDQMKALVHGGDADAAGLTALLAKHGYSWNWTTGKGVPGTTRAADALKTEWKRDSVELDIILGLISEVWGDAENAVGDATVNALRFFRHKYAGRFDDARLRHALRGTEPNTLRKRAQVRAQLAGSGTAEHHLCEMIAELYDKGRKGQRLRPKPADKE